MRSVNQILLRAPGKRDIALYSHDLRGNALPIALSLIEQLQDQGYTCEQEIPLIVVEAGKIERLRVAS
jgi:hypothetical protein